MSFNTSNNLHYDLCNYTKVMAESQGPGLYMINTPANTNGTVLPDDPHIRAQTMGSHNNIVAPLVDVDSEVKNITRTATQCPSGKYIPHNENSGFCNAPHTNNMKSTDTIAPRMEGFNNGANVSNGRNFNAYESTRLSNPPCTLRGTGWNRWEWLCQNPQDRIEVPFDHMINSTLVARDNHRPLIPKPIDQSLALPVSTDEQMCETLHAAPRVPIAEPSVNWRKSSDYGY